jgi:uncharacterized ion transporter superfamily protein YfcC
MEQNEINVTAVTGRRGFRAPDTYVIIFFVVVFAAILTYLVPVGQFDTHEVNYTDQGGNARTREVLIPESFRLLRDQEGEPVRQGAPIFAPSDRTGLLNYVFEGLASGNKYGAAVGVVVFILVIGGAFGIVMRTGAVEAGIMATIKKTSGAEILLIPAMFVVFSLGGAVFGMGEEAIAFAMILVPLCIGLGYDAVTGVLITHTATQVGFAASWMNPFSVAIAQGIAGIPVLSGAPFRIGMWAFFTLVGTAFAMLYAARVKKNPTRSAVYDPEDPFRREFQDVGTLDVRFELGHKLVLLSILLTIVWVVWGVVWRGYYIPEIATQFFVMGLVAGIIGVAFRLKDMRVDDIAVSFRSGAADLLYAALIVGMAKGIVLVLGGDDPTAPTVLNTLLHAAGQAIGDLPAALSAWFMYLFQSVFNFFVVSGSGQAALTMPLMAPLADIAGVTRQVAVLAFQLGDGFTNIIVPTSGALVGTLGVAHIDWASWARFIARFMLVLFLAGSLFVFAAVWMGYS